jgi:RecG-like helicase
LDPFPYQPFDDCKENEMIHTSGIVTAIAMKTTKTGKNYMSLKFKAKDDVERTINMFDEQKSEELKNVLKKNQIIIVKGKVSQKYKNINAQTINPVAFKKQTVDTEDIEIDDKTRQKPVMTAPVSSGTPLASIF